MKSRNIRTKRYIPQMRLRGTLTLPLLRQQSALIHNKCIDYGHGHRNGAEQVRAHTEAHPTKNSQCDVARVVGNPFTMLARMDTRTRIPQIQRGDTSPASLAVATSSWGGCALSLAYNTTHTQKHTHSDSMCCARVCRPRPLLAGRPKAITSESPPTSVPRVRFSQNGPNPADTNTWAVATTPANVSHTKCAM